MPRTKKSEVVHANVTGNAADDAPPDLKATTEELFVYARRRWEGVEQSWKRTVTEFWRMGLAWKEIKDRYARANREAGKSKRDEGYLSFSKLVAKTDISLSTVERAIDVAATFKTLDDLRGLTVTEAVSIARFLPAKPETPLELAARVKKEQEELKADAAAVDRLLATKPTEPVSEEDHEDEPEDADDEPEAAASLEDQDVVATVANLFSAVESLAGSLTRVSRSAIKPDTIRQIIADLTTVLDYAEGRR